MMRQQANALLAVGLAGALWLPGAHPAPHPASSYCGVAVKAVQQPWESLALFTDRHVFPSNGKPNVAAVVEATVACEGLLTPRQYGVVSRGDWDARLGGKRPLTWWVWPI